MAKTAKGDIVQKYLDKHPEMPSLTLAKIISAENPLDFKDVEAVRSLIRSYRGKMGKKSRADNLAGGKYYNSNPPNFAPYAMPESISVDYEPVKLPVAHNNIGLFGDMHMPNHRGEVINTIYDYFIKHNINTIILNGDILDNTPFTRHDGKRPSASEVRDWFDKAEMFFEWTREIFPNANIYWNEGNHDFWYRRWMQAHAWQLDEDPYFTLQQRLHIADYKIKFLPQELYMMAGKLSIAHGHKLMGKFGGGVMPARSVYLKTKQSTIVSHVHVSTEYTETDLHGGITTCFSTGCTCTLTPDYQPMAGRANHGFAHIITDTNGDFNVNNYRIHKGKIL